MQKVIIYSTCRCPVPHAETRCVLRMDHHCPWVDNCVGHFNYAHFIRFLWAVDIACSYHLAMISRRVWYALIYSYWVRSLQMGFSVADIPQEPSGVELAWLVANYAACLPVIVAVGVFRYGLISRGFIPNICQHLPLLLPSDQLYHCGGLGKRQSRNSYPSG